MAVNVGTRSDWGNHRMELFVRHRPTHLSTARDTQKDDGYRADPWSNHDSSRVRSRAPV